MPRQSNYKEDITPFLDNRSVQIGDSIFRFATSNDEIISSITDDGRIGLDDSKDNLEIHLYDRDDNELIKSVSFPLSEGFLYIRNDFRDDEIQFGLEIWNPERPEDSLLVKYFSDVPAGFYDVVINFFSDELGNYHDRRWQISEISTSRRELIIEPVGELNQIEFEQFVYDSIFADDFDALMRIIFDKDEQPIDFFKTIKQEFFNKLNDSSKSYIAEQGISYKDSIESGLNIILEKVFSDLENYVTTEIQEKRFRITRNNFNRVIKDFVFQSVTDNLTFLPDPGVIMRNE